MGWVGLAMEGVDTAEVPGNHQTMTREPNVGALAEAIKSRLK